MLHRTQKIETIGTPKAIEITIAIQPSIKSSITTSSLNHLLRTPQ